MGRCVAKLSRRTAERIYSMPLHCQTWLFHCSSRLHGAPPFNSIALPCTSVHCLRPAPPISVMPFHCFAMQCYSVALLSDSRPFRCCSWPFRCKSPLVHALPLPFPSEHFLRFSLHFSSVASLRTELLLIAVAILCIAPLFRCVTLLRVAIPLRYWISSQVNRPFPLFRHWPMPENRP